MNTQLVTTRLDDSHIEDVLEMIISGIHYRDIADKYNCSLYKLFCYLHSEKHSVRVKGAREMAAHILVDEAERVLAQAKHDYKLFAVAQQLAHHYRWKASMIYGRQYAPKKAVEGEENKKKEITIKIIKDSPPKRE